MGHARGGGHAMKRTLPYTWCVGVDNCFGYLHRPDGSHLAESRRFMGGRGVAVGLAHGSALVTSADGSSEWQPLTAERACELASIPPPAVDGAAETQRRLDPFHVERHTSPLFLAVVSLAVERTLPCGHALRAWVAGLWDQTFDGPFLEQPETFAAAVLERLAETGGSPADTVLAQLNTESLQPGETAIAEQTGWTVALGELDALTRHFTGRLRIDRGAQNAADRASDSQLTLL